MEAKLDGGVGIYEVGWSSLGRRKRQAANRATRIFLVEATTDATRLRETFLKNHGHEYRDTNSSDIKESRGK
jgi:hypothetical protein